MNTPNSVGHVGETIYRLDYIVDDMQTLQKSQRIKRYLELVEMWKFNPNFIEEHDVHYQTQRVDGMPLTTESRVDEACKNDKSHSEVLSQ